MFQALNGTESGVDEWCQGCGRFFEGTPAEMHEALNKTLASLPNDTKVYVSDRERWLQTLCDADRVSRGMNTRNRTSSS